MRVANAAALAEMRAQDLVHVTTSLGFHFSLQRELRSPNSLLGRHWRAKARERKRWQAAMTNAVIGAYGVASAQHWLSAQSGLANATGTCVHRRLVLVERQAPSKRHFIRDDDNLRFAVKPLLDALKQLGLIKDDRREWISLPEPTQRISPDGTFWTLVRVETMTGGQA